MKHLRKKIIKKIEKKNTKTLPLRLCHGMIRTIDLHISLEA